MMDSFALNLALRVAQDWATNNDPAYGRYFDLAPVDRQWLVQAAESDLAELASLPSSILLVNIGILSEENFTGFHTPSPAVSTISQLLGAIADDLRLRGRVAMIDWGITCPDKAKWLATSKMKDRVRLAAQGRITFAARTSFSKIIVGAPDSTVRIANLMRILSGGRRGE